MDNKANNDHGWPDYYNRSNDQRYLMASYSINIAPQRGTVTAVQYRWPILCDKKFGLNDKLKENVISINILYKNI